LRLEEDFPPDKLVERLVAAGYVREEPINNIGQFSIRGGIVDVWSPDAENPVRIEFFGDTVDSIREFDPDTQLSTGQLSEAGLAPMREFLVTPQDMKDWGFFATDRFPDERFARNLKDRADFAKEGETFSGWEFLIALTKPAAGNTFDYLSDCIFVIDEPQLIEQTLSTFYEITRQHFEQTIEADDIALDPSELFLDVEELRAKLEPTKRVELRALGRTAAKTDEEFSVTSGGEAVGNGESGTRTAESKPKSKIQNPKSRSKLPAVRVSVPDTDPLFLFPTAEKSVEL
jgi:transcription-repair coupling factor (superfamily II helicase)